ncbi:MAG: DNA polymerase III subunit delta [Chloroflexi bacterium]|nr:DNA polymerase III subunit delta [Chloroflexota bacterium]
MTKSPTFYIFHGDDDLRVEEEVGKLRAKISASPNADLNTAEFDGPQTSVGELLSAVMAYPFLSDKRLVIVRDLLAWITRKGAGETGKKAVEALVTALPTLPEWGRLIFWEREKLADSNKIVKLAQSDEHGFEKLYMVPKDSTEWILKRARETYNVEIEPAAAVALASVTGNDLRGADNELLKLIAFVNGEHPITEHDVALLTPYVQEANMFEMVDALAEGRAKAASTLMYRLLEQQEDPFAILAMINRQFRLLLMARDHLDRGGAPKEIGSALSVHPFVGEKLAKQSRAFNAAQLERIYRALHDYDVKIKTGQIDAKLALDLLLAGLAR